MRMGRRIAATLKRTALHAGPTVLGIIVLDFLFLQLMPGDAADVIAIEAGAATAETMAMLRERFGLDQPIITQLGNFLSHLVQLDLGHSARFNASVLDIIMTRLPNTVLLMATALSLALLMGIVMGSVMAAWAGKWPDRLLSVVVLLLYSMPGFWVGLMAIVLFSVKLGWLPNDSNMTVGANYTGLAMIADRAVHLVLPALALASFFVAVYSRLVRASMLEVQRQDFMRTAQAKGLHPFFIQLRHALRNALIPVTTVAGMHLGNLLGGAVVVETLFGWPGMGRLALEAVLARDFAVLLGVLLLSSLLVIAANVVIDLLHAWLDPRIGET
ncbi:MAG: ABC transporter permease [Alphaproteobacteria bacterium]|nr:ABC transporter permease [Alphaproteobacteria bacterium]